MQPEAQIEAIVRNQDGGRDQQMPERVAEPHKAARVGRVQLDVQRTNKRAQERRRDEAAACLPLARALLSSTEHDEIHEYGARDATY